MKRTDDIVPTDPEAYAAWLARQSPKDRAAVEEFRSFLQEAGPRPLRDTVRRLKARIAQAEDVRPWLAFDSEYSTEAGSDLVTPRAVRPDAWARGLPFPVHDGPVLRRLR